MAKIFHIGNGGDPNIHSGVKQINFKNVKPTTVVAVPAPGTIIPVADFADFDFFVVAQTSAGTDEITLPTGLPVGATVELQATSAVVVTVEAGSGIGINGGTDTQGVALAANASMILRKVSATRIIATHFSTAGALTAPTPA